MSKNKSLRFYLWQPFPEIEGAFIAEQVIDRGGIMWGSHRQADIIFAHVSLRSAGMIEEARRNNGWAVLVALIKRGNSSPGLKQRCLDAGANMVFYMPAKGQGFKAMFTRIYAQLQSV